MILLIFGVLIGLLLMGIPVSISIGITALFLFAVSGADIGILTMVAQRMYAGTLSFPLLAIPFFILAGMLMNEGGMTQRVFRSANSLVGHWRGGLGHVNVVASMIFAGMSGSAVADASGLGLVEIKAMDEAGYDRRFSAAITAASSTIGPVVPPSIPFVIYGWLAGVSVGDLFLAGFIPGILMGLYLMVVLYWIAKARRYPKGKQASMSEILHSLIDGALALGTPIIIVGGIIGGIFTPTEAAVIASVYALILGILVYKEIKLRDLPRIFLETTRATVRIMFIIAAASLLSWGLIQQRIPEAMVKSFLFVSEDPLVVLLLITGLLLALGCFMEGISIMLITIPVLMPLINRLELNPVHFGVLMTLCLMVALITPPVGLCLYAVSSIAKVSLSDVIKEMIPYLVALIAVIITIILLPNLVLFIPNLVRSAG